MKKRKIVLDKLVIGALSDSEAASVLGGDDTSLVSGPGGCIPPTKPYSPPATNVVAGCPVTPPPTIPTGSGFMCSLPICPTLPPQ